MIIGVDFDDTVVENAYPKVGAPVPGAIPTLLRMQDEGHKLILWTMRDGDALQKAVVYLELHGIELYGVNKNPEQGDWTFSPKAYCDVYVDNAAIGCPLIYPEEDDRRPYVDWDSVSVLLDDAAKLDTVRILPRQ